MQADSNPANPPNRDEYAQAVAHSFNIAARVYDSARRRLIPCFDDFYSTAVELAVGTASAPRILDLGAGTGLFSQMLLDARPNTRLTLIDSADAMLAQARERFAGDQRVDFVACDYMSYEPAENFDAVVSALSIHHLADADKARLYRRAFAWLRPGGRFVNADQALGDGPLTEGHYQNAWRASVLASDLPRSEFQASCERRKLDQSALLADQLRWLKEAGFAEVDCPYRFYTFAVLWAIRAA
jgi:tRNA (cmo5U34)-methyltransferase